MEPLFKVGDVVRILKPSRGRVPFGWNKMMDTYNNTKAIVDYVEPHKYERAMFEEYWPSSILDECLYKLKPYDPAYAYLEMFGFSAPMLSLWESVSIKPEIIDPGGWYPLASPDSKETCLFFSDIEEDKLTFNFNNNN